MDIPKQLSDNFLAHTILYLQAMNYLALNEHASVCHGTIQQWNTTTYQAIMFQELDKIYQEYQPARRHNFPTDKTQTIYTLNHNSASL